MNHCSFLWSGWRQSKFKINWSRSFVIGDNGFKKDVFNLIVQHSKTHQFAFLFLKDFESDIHFVIRKSFFFQHSTIFIVKKCWRNLIWIIFIRVGAQLNSLYQGLCIENGTSKKHSQTKKFSGLRTSLMCSPTKVFSVP